MNQINYLYMTISRPKALTDEETFAATSIEQVPPATRQIRKKR